MKLLYTIRTKSSLLFLVLFVVIILPVNWNIYQNTKQVLTDASHREMMFEAEKLLSNVRLDPVTVPISVNYNILLKYEDQLREEIIFSSPDFPILPPEFFVADYLVADSLELLTLRKPVDTAQGELVLSLARSNQTLLDRLINLRNYLFLVSTISVLVAGVLVYFATGRMLRPLNMIASAASRIQASESIERIPVPKARDESQTLAEALNSMLDRIERTIKNQTNFFASATHELKTPLAIMKVELSTEEFKKDERWASVLLEVERLDRVISDFLLISQLKSESLSIRKQLHPLEEVIYHSLKKISRLKDQRQASIHFQISQHLNAECDIDVDKMETVFSNVLENAIKYSSPAELSITLAVIDQEISVAITNPTSEVITEPQSLAAEFKKSKEFSEGLGMGLWISNEILKLHGGSMTLSANELNFTVLVKLPLAVRRS
jgi:signal transduction histidine kinase